MRTNGVCLQVLKERRNPIELDGLEKDVFLRDKESGTSFRVKHCGCAKGATGADTRDLVIHVVFDLQCWRGVF